MLTGLFARDGFDVSAADAQFGWVALAAPAAAGVLVTQIAAWRAARSAARISPMQALRSASTDTAGRRWPRLVGALAVFACAWLFFGPVFAVQAEEPPGPERTIGISVLILLGCMTTAAALCVLAPLFVGPLGGLVGRIGTAVSGEAGRVARATITRSPRRVSAAASSLMLGVALVGATALIVLSSDARFAEAGEEVMRADHAIAATTMTSVGQAPLPRELADRAAYVKTAADAMTSGMLVIYGFIGMALVLALFGMATTVSMSVAERTREFGLLGAVGAKVAQIRSIVRWEAATVVLLGGLLGTGTAVGTVFLMHVATGSSFLRPDPPWWLFVVITAGAAVVTLATSALPARRAASVPVLEAAKAE